MKSMPLLALAVLATSLRGNEISYSRDIAPILSNKCFFCHGPDPAKREAGLRLDSLEGATTLIKDSLKYAIVPGDPTASELIRRIRAQDSEEIMPPPKSHFTLSADEIALFEKWITEGAKYEKHWAFRDLPNAVPLPEIKDSNSARNEIDHFILARLEQEKLKPSPEADPARLLRRVSFDLTGLPPKPEEIAAFDPAHFEAAVDRLLASPHYGETMALDWLDTARYGDSYGYQSDLFNNVWPWRDWVIRAFNDNLPYDQFATWQIAGDLLPDATRDQKLATTFNRLNRMTQEGGSIHEEMRVEGVSDRVHTFGTAFLALTMECCRCHDHKYDPISARDYYSLSGFFNSIPERGVYSDMRITPGPALRLPTPEQENKIAGLQAAIVAARAELEQAHTSPVDPAAPPPADGLVADYDFEPTATANVITSHAEGPGEDISIAGLKIVPGVQGQGIGLGGDVGIHFPSLLSGDWPQPWSVDLSVRDTVANPEPVVVWQKTSGTDAGYNGYDCALVGGNVVVRIFRDWPGDAASVATTRMPVDKDRWHRITVTWDGSGKAAGLLVYVDGQAQPVEITHDRLEGSVILPVYGSGQFTIGERFRDRGFAGGEIDGLKVFSRALGPQEVADVTKLTPPSSQILAAQAKLQAARLALVKLDSEIPSIAVMDEMASPRLTWILPRGVYSTPYTQDAEAGRNTFAQILPPFPADAPRNRLGLARWLMQPNHPLTARVRVNRIWQHFFGTGLVATSDNFGFQGSPPSHPELLDWLARDFVSHGWDTKRLCRQIVLSGTYRQDSKMTPTSRELDPANVLIARGPARRLAAEPIRDLALAASDELVSTIGGPPVSPYQPGKDLWKESNSMTIGYKQSTGPDLRRRSIYSVWKRTAPLPNALIFDAPGRDTCTVSRGSTNTPLQALVLLNDPQFLEPSRALAEVVLKAYPSDASARISAAFVRLAGRQPQARELDVLNQLLVHQLAEFTASPDDAKAFLKIGEKVPDAALDPTVLAAHTIVCQAILNLDAVIWNR